MASALDKLQAEVATLRATLAAQQDSADTFWLLFCGVLVFFMQCGFGMLEAGAVGSRSTQDIMLKNLFDAALGALLFWFLGYGFVNEGGSGFIGFLPTGNRTSSYFATASLMQVDADETTPPASALEWANVFFQFTFAAASATIVSGAVAERTQLPAYICFSSCITGLVYPVVAHWVWAPSGWLSTSNPDAVLGGVVDFAGSGVVHMTGGIAALCGAIIVGPRTNRFDEDGRVLPMPGHSAVLQVFGSSPTIGCLGVRPDPNPNLNLTQVLGTFILWLGWYGFNAGSTLGIGEAQARLAARVVLTTTLAAATGGTSAVTLECFRGVNADPNPNPSGITDITLERLPWHKPTPQPNPKPKRRWHHRRLARTLPWRAQDLGRGVNVQRHPVWACLDHGWNGDGAALGRHHRGLCEWHHLPHRLAPSDSFPG